MGAGCNPDGVCRHPIASQGATAPMILNADEAASFDVPGDGNGVRVVVESTRPNAKVVVHLIDVASGKVVAISAPNESTKLD